MQEIEDKIEEDNKLIKIKSELNERAFVTGQNWHDN